jgi:hypothetical protein
MKNVYVLLLLICFIVVSHLQRDFGTDLVQVASRYIYQETNIASVTTVNTLFPFSIDIAGFSFFR